MKLPKELTTVTRLSKFVALIMFITLPIIAFAFGMNYKEYMQNTQNFLLSKNNAAKEYPCELDVIACPDNSLLGRQPPKCDFQKCAVAAEPSADEPTISTPTSTPIPTSVPQTGFKCPEGNWVDCMPGPGKGKKKECGSEYLNWARENCPDFQGAAL